MFGLLRHTLVKQKDKIICTKGFKQNKVFDVYYSVGPVAFSNIFS